MKTIFFIIGILAVIVIGILLLRHVPNGKNSFASLFPQSAINTFSQGTADIKGHTIKLLEAKTPKEQHIGLSDRSSLSQDMGMIFPFTHPDYYQFWMRRMEFPLDIIYLNGNKVVTLLENVQNPPYSMENPPILRPDSPADKVLEVNSGTAKRFNLKIGDTINLTL